MVVVLVVLVLVVASVVVVLMVPVMAVVEVVGAMVVWWRSWPASAVGKVAVVVMVVVEEGLCRRKPHLKPVLPRSESILVTVMVDWRGC